MDRGEHTNNFTSQAAEHQMGKDRMIDTFFAVADIWFALFPNSKITGFTDSQSNRKSSISQVTQLTMELMALHFVSNIFSLY